MALRGTLKDFGVAEILQLIAQQTKTGILRLRSGDEEIHVCFDMGNVVRAEHVTANEAHLLGHRLVRAGLITERELEDALEEQRRTLRRLGDVLVDRGAIDRDDLRQMAQLQTTETLYRLFTWKSGTYEFEAIPVDWDRDAIQPIRGEALLMEGFRMIDEWPLIRQRIQPGMTFERLRELPERPGRESKPEPELDLDLAFGSGEPTAPPERSGSEIGTNEYRVMELIQSGRSVERLVELSRLGEFETWKALYNLVGAGFLRAIPAPGIQPEAAQRGGRFQPFLGWLATFSLQVAITAGLLALLTGLVYVARAGDRPAEGLPVVESSLHRLLAGAQRARIAAALEVHRLEEGSYPESLEELVAEGLLEPREIRHPWREAWHYRRLESGGFVLLPPLE